MTDNRFEGSEPRVARDEPRIAGDGAPVRPADEAMAPEAMAQDDAAREADALDLAPTGTQDDDDALADPNLIARPAQFGVAREEKGWSVNEVAGRLRMQVRQIEAIEAGRWQDLPGTAFVRAAIRSYARLLDRDPAPLLASVAQLDTGLDLRSTHRAPVAISPTGSFGETSGIGRWGLALLGLLAVIAIAFYFAPSGELRWPSQWFDGEGGTSADRNSTIAQAPPAPGVASPPMRGALPSAASPSDDAVAAAARAANELLGSQPGTGESATGAGPGEPVADSPGASTRGSSGLAAGAASTGSALPSATDGSAGSRAGSQPRADPSGVASAARGGAEAASQAAGAAAGQAAAPASGASVVAGTSESAASEPGARPGVGVDAMASAASALSTPAAADSASSLTMIFDAECWVEVSDAQGKRLVYGLQKPRTSLSLDVAGPVSVLVGNADAVTMSRGGEPVDVQSQSRDGVAKLRLE